MSAKIMNDVARVQSRRTALQEKLKAPITGTAISNVKVTSVGDVDSETYNQVFGPAKRMTVGQVFETVDSMTCAVLPNGDSSDLSWLAEVYHTIPGSMDTEVYLELTEDSVAIMSVVTGQMLFRLVLR